MKTFIASALILLAFTAQATHHLDVVNETGHPSTHIVYQLNGETHEMDFTGTHRFGVSDPDFAFRLLAIDVEGKSYFVGGSPLCQVDFYGVDQAYLGRGDTVLTVKAENGQVSCSVAAEY